MLKQLTIYSFLCLPMFGWAQITALSGSTVNNDGGGNIIVGDNSSFNIAIDNDDIQAKNGNNYSELFLNYYDGDVNLAYGQNGTSTAVKIGTRNTNQGNLNAYNVLHVKGDTDRVGIGTNDPQSQLHVKGGNMRISNGAPGVFLKNNDEEDLGQMFSFLSALFLKNQATGSLADILLQTEFGQIRLEDDGKLAIGDENNPLADIHLKQTENDEANDGGLLFENSDDSDAWKLYMSGSHFSFADWVGGDQTRRAYIEDDTGDYVQPSDKNKKTDIANLTNVLEKVQTLRPVAYRYKVAKKNAKKTIGFLAQEVAETFPELVHYDEDNEPGLAYSQFAVIAIKAIQEQQQVVQEKAEQVEQLSIEKTLLQTKVAQLETQLADVASMVEYRLTEIENSLQTCCFSSNLDELPNQLVILPTVVKQPTLQQNTPNPFNEQTVVSYYLPNSVEVATLQIMNLQGQVIEEVQINEKGAGQFTLSAGQLSAGSYFYSLLVDGQLIDTKKMVLTK